MSDISIVFRKTSESCLKEMPSNFNLLISLDPLFAKYLADHPELLNPIYKTPSQKIKP